MATLYAQYFRPTKRHADAFVAKVGRTTPAAHTAGVEGGDARAE